ncbi:MAG: T9SS type A sorting domain-containing protein [Bacteroidota bacterium]
MTTPLPVVDFDGLLDNTHVIPPDTYGGVGPDHVVTMLNSEVQIQNKSGTALSKVSLSAFWSGGVGSSNLSDPHVLYDALSGRWFASITINPDTATSRIGVAISANSNPLGSWRFLTYFSPDTTIFPDYPTLGFNNKWIVVTANMFKTTVHGGSDRGPAFWAIDKAAAMQSSGSVSAVRFDPGYDGKYPGFTEQPMICYTPCDTLWIVQSGKWLDGSAPLIRISSIAGPVGSPTFSLSAGSPFPGTGFFYVPNNFQQLSNGAPQQGSTHTLDNGDARALSAVYRTGRLWFVHSGGLPSSGTVNRTATFWYELDPRSTSPIVQSGIIDPGANSHLLYPSISVNALNSACIGFTRTDATRYAEAAYAIRQAGDLAGTTQGIAVLQAGQGVYFKTFGGGRNRWGDFSNTVVDPSDSLTFWTIQEYAGTPVGNVAVDGSGRWATHWGKIVVDVPLAVQLTGLSGTMKADGSVRIAWTTASEVACYGFRIERSAMVPDNYQSLPDGFVAGHGTTLELHTYSFDDFPVASGKYFYRLTEVDLDGSTHPYEPISVDVLTAVQQSDLPTQTSLRQNYPNPFNPSTTIEYSLANATRVKLSVYDLVGREVAVVVEGVMPAGNHSAVFAPKGLSSGVYFYRFRAGTFVDMKRLVLVK